MSEEKETEVSEEIKETTTKNRTTGRKKKTPEGVTAAAKEDKPKRTRRKKTETAAVDVKPKRTRKKKTVDDATDLSAVTSQEKPKRTRRKKKTTEEQSAAPEIIAEAGTETPLPEAETENIPGEAAEDTDAVEEPAEEPAVSPVDTSVIPEENAEQDVLDVIDEPHEPAPDETKPIPVIQENTEVLESEMRVAEVAEAPVIEEESVPGRMPDAFKVLKNPFLYMETLSMEGNYDRLMLAGSLLLKWALPLVFAVYALSVRINARPFSYVRMTFSDGAWVWLRALCFGVIGDLCGNAAMIMFLKRSFRLNDLLYQLGGDRMFLAIRLIVYTAAALIAVFSPFAGLSVFAAGMAAGILLRAEITLKQADNKLSAWVAVMIYIFVTVLIFGLFVHIGFSDVFRIISAV